jgi:hypothetical protein
MMPRVLVIGGGGTFGSLLVRGILAATDFGVVIAGRDLKKAQALVEDLLFHSPGREIEAAVLDRDGIAPDDLRALGVFAVVDAAGPFQHAEAKVAEAAIEAGVHYLDLADARDFVAAFPRLDARAKARGVTAISGASSTPALSHAVLDSLTSGWRAVDSIEVAISPGNRAPRGVSVVAAILSYAGRPVRVFVDGEWRERAGWSMLTRRMLPGIGRRWLSLCETPDLDLIPERFRVRRSAVFRAGLELPVLHLGLWAASLLVRARVVSSLEPCARFFRGIAGLLSGLGTDRGGMIVEARGIGADNRAAETRWTLVAEAGDGPVIPTLPALAALRRLAEGRLWAGAYPCVGGLTLDEIETEFRPYRIRTRVDSVRQEGSLFATALGPGFDDLPEPIRAAHTPGWSLVLRGSASVTGAENALGRVAARIFRLPRPNGSIPVKVTMEAFFGKEVWTREFGGHRFKSVLSGRTGGLSERFGALTFDLHVPTSADGLDMHVVGWRIGRLPLPGRLAPIADARERLDAEGRFSFDVAISLPLAGRLVRYRGWLMPAAENGEPSSAAVRGTGRDGVPPG